MRLMIVMGCALMVAACGQTTGSARRAPAEPVAAAGPQKAVPPRTAERAGTADPCADAVDNAVQAQTNAAMLGGALGMVGGLGGFGGRGGMVVAQAAQVGGSVVQSQARAQAQAGMRECM